MTPSGFAWMKKRLKRMKEVDRIEIAKAIEVARDHGDLKENAEYHAAKEEQGLLAAKIREFEAKLALSEVIDPTTLSGEKVMFGATVTMIDAETEEEKTYTLVGEHEASIKNGRIAVVAPLARAMVGKSIGDEVVLKTSKGVREYEITDVQWNPVEWMDP